MHQDNQPRADLAANYEDKVDMLGFVLVFIDMSR